MFFLILRILFVIGFFIFLLYRFVFVIVPEHSVFIVEYFGKYTRSLEKGFHFLIPIVERITYRISLKEQTLIIKSLKCETLDNGEFLIDSVLVFQVFDPPKAAYESENYAVSILESAKGLILAEIHNNHSEELLATRYGMNQNIVKQLSEEGKNLGIKIIRFELQQMVRNAKIT